MESIDSWRRAADHRHVRLPDAGRSDVEARLAAANERARDDAVATLGALLPGIDAAGIAQRTDGGTLSLSTLTRDGGFVPDPERLLNRLIGDHDAGNPRLRVAHRGAASSLEQHLEQVHPIGIGPDGSNVAMSTARVPGGRLASILANGGTLVVDGADLRDAHLGRLSEACERVFDCNVNINAYISLRPQPGFGFHWDDHEVFILQMLGRKGWEVQEPVALSPNRAIHDWSTSGRTVWKARIEPGQALHVPRGWGHDATAGDELTFHLTVTIPRLDGTGASQLGLSASRVDDGGSTIIDVGLGAPIPPTVAVHRILGNVVSAEGVDRAVAAYRANILPRPSQAVTAALHARAGDRTGFVRSCHGGGVLWADDGPDQDPDTVSIAFGRRVHHTDRGTATFLAPLLDGRARRLADLDGLAGDGRTRDRVDEALAVGLFEVVDPDDWGVVVDGGEP